MVHFAVAQEQVMDPTIEQYNARTRKSYYTSNQPRKARECRRVLDERCRLGASPLSKQPRDSSGG